MSSGRKESARIRKSVWYVSPYHTTLCARRYQARVLGDRDEANRKPGARPSGLRIVIEILSRERERRSQAAGLRLSYRT